MEFFEQALGIDSRADQIERAWNLGKNDWVAIFKAGDLAEQEKWSTFIFYLACISVVPAVVTIAFNPALGLGLSGTVGAVGGISWARRRTAIDAVEQEKLARQE